MPFSFKFWADLNTAAYENEGAFYGVTSTYESTENMTIQCSTKVCSFGKQVVEKVETEYARFEGGRFIYKLHRSPMCEYMINFILKLKHLPNLHEKQCPGKLHNSSGDHQPRYSGNSPLHRLRI